MIPYGRQFIDEDDVKAVIEVLRSDWLTQGPKVSEFEESLSAYSGTKYAVVFNSGTSALHGAYFALGIRRGDEFITTPNTFVATANAGLYLGAKPVFADVEEETGNINTDEIEKKITKKTKLLAPVHYAGHPVDLENVYEIAKRHHLFVVEDACHALGAEYRPQGSGFKVDRTNEDEWIKVGRCTYSDMTVLSFHPVKHIATGEGGAVLTDDKGYYDGLLMFRNHGITKDRAKFTTQNPKGVGDWYYEMQFLGHNYRMTDIQAALGVSQLGKLDSFVKRRREIAGIYNKAFENNDYFDIPVERVYARSSYHLYPIRLKEGMKNKKIKVFSAMREKGLGVQVHYIPIYLHPYYQRIGFKPHLCPVAENFSEREISIPLYPAMTKQDVEDVVDKICETFKEVM
jgi:UDP-4-amino-4,6-dideoxy-N-acetyl-beta-L-altrosamine transaminase